MFIQATGWLSSATLHQEEAYKKSALYIDLDRLPPLLSDKKFPVDRRQPDPKRISLVSLIDKEALIDKCVNTKYF